MTETLLGPALDPTGKHGAKRRATPTTATAGALPAAIPAQRAGSDIAGAPSGGPVSTGRVEIAICNWRDLSHPEGGGSELYVEQVARGLAALGNTVTVLCAKVSGVPRDEVRDGVRYRRRGGRFTVYLHAAVALLTRRVRPDVVVDVQNGLPWLSRLVSRRPVVVLMHHVHREQWPIAVGPTAARVGWWVERAFAPRLYRHCGYVAVSESTRTELAGLGVSAQRVALAHNGTPNVPDGALPRSATPRVIVLGRLVPHKRVEIVIDAVARLQDRFPELVVDVVGRGWWLDRLVEHAHRAGVADRVVFHGFVSDQRKADLLAQAWVNAVPSTKEGWALSVVEAATQRTPSIAYAGAGGLDESIVHGVTGLLVHGEQEDFAAVLGDTLGDEELRRRLGDAGASRAAGFTWQRTTARWVELLDRVVADSR